MSRLTPKSVLVNTALLLCMSLASTARAADDNDELLVDPTVPLGMVISPDGESDGEGGGFDLLGMFTSFELSSVLIRAQDRIAVINEERVRVGDSIGGARVTAIEPDHVTLNMNGRVETLELYGASIKTLSKVTSNDDQVD